MTQSDALPPLVVPERVIPVPSSVSKEAQEMLALGLIQSAELPALSDVEGWRRWSAETDAAVLSYVLPRLPSGGFDVRQLDCAGVPIYVIRPPNVDTGDTRVCLEIHGGGMVHGGGECCKAIGVYWATKVGIPIWTVDYRMPPDHPYPAALDDCLSAYRALLRDHRPEAIIVSGASAGANLAAAMILRARDEGLAMPAVTILLTPELDLTESGDTFHTNLGVDTVLTQSFMPANLLYADGHDLADPYLSPIFGDFSTGFPPTLLASGTRDLFLSNTVRMHRALRAAGVQADLHVFEAAPHGGFMADTPEDATLEVEVRLFIDAHCSLEG